MKRKFTVRVPMIPERSEAEVHQRRASSAHARRLFKLDCTRCGGGSLPVLYSDQFGVSGSSPFQAMFAGRICVISAFSALFHCTYMILQNCSAYVVTD